MGSLGLLVARVAVTMAHISPLSSEELETHRERLAVVEQLMGFVPNSMPTMARVPGLLESFQGLARVVLGNDLVPHDLKQLIALVVSIGSGCRYCQSHTAHSAHRLGVSETRLADVWTFETSDQFSDAERAALRVAFHAGQVPNEVTESDMEELKRHWSDDQIAAIVAVISLFGYLNRWNDTMATTLEDAPRGFGEQILAENGWIAGKHHAS